MGIVLKFTIITVCKNAEKLIEYTINSVLAQTFYDYEYVIIDGLSSDGTVEIIKSFAMENSNIFWVSEPDSGLYSAMNKGISIASGEWIHFLHAGDIYASIETLEKVAEIATNGYDVLATSIIIDQNFCSLLWQPCYSEENRHYSFPHTGIFITKDFYMRNHKYRENFKIISDGLYYSDNFSKAKMLINPNSMLTVIMNEGISNTITWRYVYENIFNALFLNDYSSAFRLVLIKNLIKKILKTWSNV